MKAATVEVYGSPEVVKVKEVANPEPKNNEVLIRVQAATVNRTDCAIRKGNILIMRFFTGLFKPSKSIPGTDFAGIVVSTGSEVSEFKKGDHVFGFDDMGLSSHAEYMTMKQNKNISIMPEDCSFEQAASSLEGVHYAYNIFLKSKLSPNSKVIVNGASGAIGSALVQMLLAHGHQVDAVCGTENIETVKSLGVDRIFDYKKEDFTSSPEKYAAVLDAVGKSRYKRCNALLEENGVYISSELGKNGENIFLPLLNIFSKKKVVFPIPFDVKRSISMIKGLIEQRKFKALIDRRYDLENISEAFVYADSGEKVGNLVLNLSKDEKL